MASFTADQRRVLAAAIAAGRPPVCPDCQTRVGVRAVERPEEVAYVRRRLWLLCPSCKRTAALDAAGRGGPASD